MAEEKRKYEKVTIDGYDFKDVMQHINAGEVLMNADCLFVEYMDMIKTPWFILLSMLTQNEKVESILDLDKIRYMDSESLFEWYCRRKNRNFLYDLAKENTNIDYDILLETLMGSNEIFYKVNTELNVVRLIREVFERKLAKSIKIYNENDNEYIRKDIVNVFGKTNSIKFVHGTMKEVLEDVPANSTFILSDINKVMDLKENKKLNYASIVLPNDYDYNFIMKDGKRTPLLDFDYIAIDHLFKVHYIIAAHV